MRRSLANLTLALIMLALEAGGADPLRITAHLPPSVSVYYPVEVELVFENAGSQPIVLEDFPHLRLVRVDILTASDHQPVHRGFVSPTADSEGESYRTPVPLAVGESRTVHLFLANQWTEEKALVGPAFTQPGRYLLSFRYTATWEAARQKEVKEIGSPEVPLQVTEFEEGEQSAGQTLRKQPHVAWTLEPRAAFRLGNEAALATWEQELRSLLRVQPGSAWTSLSEYALALRVFDRAARSDGDTPALLKEASSLVTSALSTDKMPYRHQALGLRQRLETAPGATPSKESRAMLREPPSAEAVRAEFAKLIKGLGEGDMNGVQALLDPAFRYNSRLDTAAWLREWNSEVAALAPAKLEITAQPISVEATPAGTILTADLSLVAGSKKANRRVQMVYQELRGRWLLTSWSDRGVP